MYALYDIIIMHFTTRFQYGTKMIKFDSYIYSIYNITDYKNDDRIRNYYLRSPSVPLACDEY